MKKLFAILSLALSLAAATTAVANDELDNEKNVINAEQRALAQNLPATLVVRINKVDGSVSVLHSDKILTSADSSEVSDASFVEMKATDTMQKELDKDSSTSGWYFYWYNYSYTYPSYYYYGYTYNYQSYYNYSWGNYSYYWYRWY